MKPAQILRLDSRESSANENGLGYQSADVDGGLIKLAFVPFAVLAILCSSGWEPPLWFQPTSVGLIWAGLIWSGAAARSMNVGRWPWLVTLLGFLWLAKLSNSQLMTLSSSESALLVSALVGAGWTLQLLMQQATLASSDRKSRQWSMADIVFLTTFVAIACQALPRIEASGMLVGQIFLVAVSGVAVSYITWVWVLDDNWNFRKVAYAGIGLLSSLSFVTWAATDQWNWMHLLRWLLVGPIAVVAAQGLGILLLLAAVRADRHVLQSLRS